MRAAPTCFASTASWLEQGTFRSADAQNRQQLSFDPSALKEALSLPKRPAPTRGQRQPPFPDFSPALRVRKCSATSRNLGLDGWVGGGFWEPATVPIRDVWVAVCHPNTTITSRASCSSAFLAPKWRCMGLAAPLPTHTSQTQHVPKVFGDSCQIMEIKAAAPCSAERNWCHSPPPLGFARLKKTFFAQLKQNQQKKRRVSRSRCSWEMRQKAG